MPGKVKAVIFDLDGVIIDSNPAIEAFWKSWTDRENIQLSDALIREWIYGRKVGDTIKGLFNHLSQERKKEIETSAYTFDSTMHPGAVKGVVSFIQQLVLQGIPMGVVTSSHRSRMLTMLTSLSIENSFTHFITAHDVTRGKPHPEPYLKMSEKMNLPENECLVFEDAISGIQSAVAAGMQSIGIGNHLSKPGLLQWGAKDVMPDFTYIHIDQKQLITANGIRFPL